VPPTRPPGGITPELPGGVAPPVGTVPPTQTRPDYPPPPSAVSPPSPTPTAKPEGVAPMREDGRLGCPDPRTLPPGTPVRPECKDAKPQCFPDHCEAGLAGVPVTPGRDFGVGLQADWNLWTDVAVINSSDGRYGLDVSGWTRTATVGLDRRVGDRWVVGLSASLEDSRVGGYGGFFSGSTHGATLTPYVAVLLSNNWAIDVDFSYSRLSNDFGLTVLQGSYLSQRLTGAANLHGQYDLDILAVRPRLSFAYTKTFSDGYDMQGAVLGRSISVNFPTADYDYSFVELAAEFNRVFTTSGGTVIMPFAEVGAVYELVRPNGGQMLTSDLQLVIPSPWSFSTRAGVRMLISQAIQLEARAGYLSFGQSGLNVVEAGLRFSVSF
jgi:outer membrane autotransporter protein